jgi:hypothetical protein
MSIEALRPRDPSYRDDSDQASKPIAQKTVETEAKTPDFSATIFSAVHLPTGLVASSRPTVATVMRDAADLKTKLDAVTHDLKSPELAAYATSAVGVYTAYVKLNVGLGTLGMAVYGLAKGDAKDLLVAVRGVLELPAKAKDMTAAHREFAKANGPKTNAALAKLGRDLMAMQEAAIKLASDARRIGGAP